MAVVRVVDMVDSIGVIDTRLSKPITKYLHWDSPKGGWSNTLFQFLEVGITFHVALA